MKTESHSINDVLAKNATSFFIPPFQRAYAWGKPEIERYFYDIMHIIESELNPKDIDKLEHFFGTLVIKEEKDGFAHRSIVVDGQQRLTTTLIFLIAIRDLETDASKQEYITQNYLKNNTSTFQDKIKLKQVTKDWEAYKALINQSQPYPGLIYNAYKLFTKFIKENKQLRPEIQIDNYITAIQRMNVAVIFLDERRFKGEDPQIIFETLNSLGKPLTLSDLVRNFILLKMNSKEQSDIYEKNWHPKIELVLGDKTSKFFRDYLQYKTVSSIKVVSDNNTKEIYHLFKTFVDTEFNNHNEFINDIIKYVDWYKWIVNEIVTDLISNDDRKDKKIKELLRNIFHDIKSEAFKPFVLGLLEYHQDETKINKFNDDELISILTKIRTYLIRRRVLGLTQGENKSIVLLCDRINKLATKDVSILELFSNMIYHLRLPNDNELITGFRKINFYEGLKRYSKFILGKIEEHNTKVAVDFRNPKITIEHIMPQKLNDAWKTELGNNYDEIHKKYLHGIGNLILTEFNQEMGNKPFFEKKEKLKTSSLSFRLNILDKEIWNKDSIEKNLVDITHKFLVTFSLPNEYKESDNWKFINNESIAFSPLDDEAGYIAEGNKPSEIKIDGHIIKVKSWQEVFLKFIQYLKNNPEYDFDIILDNQSELFKKEETILKWSVLQSLIDDNIDLTNRYKTLEGKFWDKVKKLNDDTLFIHISFSTSTLMNRIANIMNKFNMSDTFFEITLRD